MEDRKRSAAAAVSTSTSTDEDNDGPSLAKNERLLLKRLAVVADPEQVNDVRYVTRSPNGSSVPWAVQKLPPLSEKRKEEVWKILHHDLPTVDNDNSLPLEKLADLCINEYLGYKGEDYMELTGHDNQHYEGDAEDYYKGYYDWDKYEFDFLSLGYHPIGAAYKVFIVKNGGVALINHIMKRSMIQENNKTNNNSNRVMGEVIRCLFHLIAYSLEQSVRMGVVQSVIQLMNNYAEDEYIQVYGCGFLDKFAFCCMRLREDSVVVKHNGIMAIVKAMERWPVNEILQKWSCQALATICMTDNLVGRVFEAHGLAAVARVVENKELFGSHTKKFALSILEKLFAHASQQQQQQRGVSVSCCDKEDAPGENNGDDDDDENDDDTSYIPSSSDEEDEDDDNIVCDNNDDNIAFEDEDFSLDDVSDYEDDDNLVGSRWHSALRSFYRQR